MTKITVNMKQMHRWNPDFDNIRFFGNIHRGNGTVLTLDARPYVEFLNEFSIFYTMSK